MLVDDLDRHVTMQALVAGAVDRSHSPVSELLDDLVLGEVRKDRRFGDRAHSSTRTRMEFVVPATPVGAPKTATILSPGEPKPLVRTKSLARSTMLSVSRSCSM